MKKENGSCQSTDLFGQICGVSTRKVFVYWGKRQFICALHLKSEMKKRGATLSKKSLIRGKKEYFSRPLGRYAGAVLKRTPQQEVAHQAAKMAERRRVAAKAEARETRLKEELELSLSQGKG